MTIDTIRTRAFLIDVKKEAMFFLDMCTGNESIGKIATNIIVVTTTSVAIGAVRLIALPMLAIDKIQRKHRPGQRK